MVGSSEIFLVVILISVLAGLLPTIFYLITLSKALRLCSPNNRAMEPGQVWLVFIPVFGIVWSFIMVGHIADSLANEFRQRNITVSEARPGYNLGLTYLILRLCGIVPLLGILALLGAFICWIMYWVKIAEYNKLLENSSHTYMQQPGQYQHWNQNPPRI